VSSARARRRALVAALTLAAALPAFATVAPATAHPAAHHKHKHHKAKKKVDRHRPSRPVVHATGVTGGVRFTWTASKHATRYRVHWAPAAFDQWPGALGWMVDRTSGGWIPASRRSSTRMVPTNYATDRTMTALPYGNPVFGQVQANNRRAKRGATTKSSWVMGFPVAPLPGAGNRLRFATYNLDGPAANFDERLTPLVRNLAEHGVEVASVQEIRNGNLPKVLSALSARTGRPWSGARTSNGELAVIFDSSRFAEVASGSFGIHNYDTGGTLETPWVRLRPVGSSYTQEFYVVPVHFVPGRASDGSHQAANNIDTGRNAADVAAKIGAIDTDGAPIIVAGDMTSNNTHWGDTSPAQPTFVRNGYWDAMAARSKAGYAYGTVNKLAAQKRLNSGLGGRPDAIFLRGFGPDGHGNGALTYVNVANWTGGYAKPPSDHNLVYADVVVPQH
jgi:hypothetical protein